MVGLLQFLVAGGDGAMLLEAVDRPLHDVALVVGGAVEAGAAARLVAAAGDDRADAAAAQTRSDRRAGIPLVSGRPLRSYPWAARPWPGHRPVLQQGGHLR